MKKRKSIILIITVIAFLSLLILCILLINPKSCDKSQGKAEDVALMLKDALSKKEVIIDAALDQTTAFAIISKTERSDYGDTFAIFDKRGDGSWIRVYENDFKNLKPWKIELADIDGDRVKEIVTAVRKTTHFDKTEKNRLFVFNYTDGKLVKKWTGSQIAGVWEDFVVGDFAPTKGSEVIFIRHTASGERVSIYYWYHFGFLLLMESKDYENITEISDISANCMRITYQKGNKTYETILKAKNKILTETSAKPYR